MYMHRKILTSVFFGVVLLAVGGCASQPVEAPWTARYVGEKGYFRIPVRAKPKGLQRCEPVTLLKFYSDGEFLELDVRQSGSTYRVICVGDETVGCAGYLPGNAVQNGHQRAIDEIFTSRIPVEQSDVVVLTRRVDGSEMTPKDALCSGGLWKGMSREQVLFVLGQPQSQKNEPEAEIWTYPTGGSYRFEGGELVSWSN